MLTANPCVLLAFLHIRLGSRSPTLSDCRFLGLLDHVLDPVGWSISGTTRRSAFPSFAMPKCGDVWGWWRGVGPYPCRNPERWIYISKVNPLAGSRSTFQRFKSGLTFQRLIHFPKSELTLQKWIYFTTGDLPCESELMFQHIVSTANPLVQSRFTFQK